MKGYIKLLLPILMFMPLVTLASLDTNLKYGSRGIEVSELRDFFVSKGLLSGQVSGNFFSLTRNAVVAYQTSVGLPATGFVGPMTREKVNAELANVPAISAETVETGTTTVADQQIQNLLNQVNLLRAQISDIGNKDIMSPVISNISVRPASVSAYITWNINKPASNSVYYSLATPVVSNPTVKIININEITNHDVALSLTGLTASTTYYFVSVSKDMSGNTATSSEQSFTTELSLAPNVPTSHCYLWHDPNDSSISKVTCGGLPGA